ncbi:hypothetical protein EDO6_04518 [Paenibacillus xylanexedens]|nr:hypothetical protein EDO6_04518 [Paenibacillus xylanexedens]
MTFIIVPLMIYLSLYFSRKMSKAFKRMFADIADYNAYSSDRSRRLTPSSRRTPKASPDSDVTWSCLKLYRM